MITLSCGHRVVDFNSAIDTILKTYDYAGHKQLDYSVMCSECFRMYRQAGDVLYTKTEAYAWLLS
jgi:hypothetical protein